MQPPHLPPEEEVRGPALTGKDAGVGFVLDDVRDLIRLPRLLREARQVFPLAAASLIGAAAVITLAYLISAGTGHRLDFMTRDPAAIANQEFYFGLLSTAGVMVWGAMTGAALAGAMLPAARQPAARVPARYFLSLVGVGLLLGLDDAFLFHEDLFPNYLRVPEKYVWLAYMALMAGWLLFFHRTILKTGFLLMLTAFGFLGLSLATDVLTPRGELQTFLEDSLKFTGMIFLLAYTLYTVRLSVMPDAEKEVHPRSDQESGQESPPC
jgi:hypothetical protein